jgi:ribosomal protein L32
MPERAHALTEAYVCPECGTQTKASRRSGRLYEHPAPSQAGLCPKSGHVVLPGEDSYECACGAWARVTHKKTLAQHSTPEGERCPLSGEPTEAPAARPVVDGLLRMVPPAPSHGWAKPVTAGSGSSVYAIPAGLPGHGRRR